MLHERSSIDHLQAVSLQNTNIATIKAEYIHHTFARYNYVQVQALCRLCHAHMRKDTRLFLPSQLPCLHSKAWKLWNKSKKGTQLVRSIAPGPIPRLPHNSLGMRLCSTPSWPVTPANKIKQAGVQGQRACTSIYLFCTIWEFEQSWDCAL